MPFLRALPSVVRSVDSRAEAPSRGPERAPGARKSSAHMKPNTRRRTTFERAFFPEKAALRALAVEVAFRASFAGCGAPLLWVVMCRLGRGARVSAGTASGLRCALCCIIA